jgi:hypothetical protein
MDFQKAFDKVPHKRLLEKIKSYGILGSTLNWIEDFIGFFVFTFANLHVLTFLRMKFEKLLITPFF